MPYLAQVGGRVAALLLSDRDWYREWIGTAAPKVGTTYQVVGRHDGITVSLSLLQLIKDQSQLLIVFSADGK